jgi:2-polyprenyl-6-methoxyphenol hydroxylase-like FAD-dependent oxidoreductase
VLIGDAQRPAHYSIGSGTRLAFEDSIALFRAVQRHPGDVPALLETFVAEREPVKAKLTAAAERSFNWYEDFRERMARSDVVGLAYDFLTRTGRITPERLVRDFPRFMERYRKASPEHH